MSAHRSAKSSRRRSRKYHHRPPWPLVGRERIEKVLRVQHM